jgi:hypothetical protein
MTGVSGWRGKSNAAACAAIIASSAWQARRIHFNAMKNIYKNAVLI